MNRQLIELSLKGTATVATLGVLILGVRQEQRIAREDLDKRFQNLDTKFTDQLKALDTKFTDRIKALDTKITELDKKIDIMIALG